jgi:GTPase SAR1 family protein
VSAQANVWVHEIRKVMGNDIVIAIAGNKVDLERNRNVDNQEAEA